MDEVINWFVSSGEGIVQMLAFRPDGEVVLSCDLSEEAASTLALSLLAIISELQDPEIDPEELIN
jgi:hypothetical protein